MGWDGWDHWTTARLDHRSESGAKKNSSLFSIFSARFSFVYCCIWPYYLPHSCKVCRPMKIGVDAKNASNSYQSFVIIAFTLWKFDQRRYNKLKVYYCQLRQTKRDDIQSQLRLPDLGPPLWNEALDNVCRSFSALQKLNAIEWDWSYPLPPMDWHSFVTHILMWGLNSIWNIEYIANIKYICNLWIGMFISVSRSWSCE